MSSPLDPFVAAGLLRQQLILHLLARLGARVWLMASPLGWAHTPALHLLVGLFMVYDLGLALGIWHGRLSLLARWLLDTADVTFWAFLCPPAAPYTAAVVVAVPLMFVIPIRRGIPMAITAAAGMTTVIATARAMQSAEPYVGDTLLYLGMGIVLGVIVLRILRAEASRQRKHAHVVAQADLVAAALAGRNEVVTGVGREAIDDLQTSIMRLSLAQVDAASELRKAVAQHKQRLGEETRAEAVYLRDALDEYAARRRADEPAVARHVFFNVAGEDGVQVLSQRQTGQLAEQLTAAEVTGEVDLQMLPRRPRDPIVMQVGEARVTLSPNPEARVRLPVAPIAMTGLALYVLSMSNTNYSGVPVQLTIPLAALVLAYATVGAILIRRLGERVEPWVAVGTLAPFILVALLTARAATAPGPARLTLLGPLVGVALILGAVVRPPAAVLAAWLALGLASVAVVWSQPGLSGRYVDAELIWPTIMFVGAHLAGRAVSRLSQDLSRRLNAEGVEEAEQRGQRAARAELDYLWDVLERGEMLCQTAESGLIRNQVVQELHRVRGVLQQLQYST